MQGNQQEGKGNPAHGQRGNGENYENMGVRNSMDMDDLGRPMKIQGLVDSEIGMKCMIVQERGKESKVKKGKQTLENLGDNSFTRVPRHY